MSEDTPTCRIHKKHSSIKCQNSSWPGDPDGLCILHSQDKTKDPEAFREAVQDRFNQEGAKLYDFRAVFFIGRFSPDGFLASQEINKAIDFSEATFSGEAFFFLTTFMERAVFIDSTFMERAFFLDASFAKEVNFHDANFEKEAVFSGAKFLEEARFSGTIFMGEFDFAHVTFMKQALFDDTTFTGKGDFHWANFMNGAFFSGAKIQGRLLFYACNSLAPGLTAAFRGEFRHLEVIQMSALRFQDIDLGQVSFLNTDLRQIEFHHAQWHPYRGRQAIYDEVFLRQLEKENHWFRTWLLFYAPYTSIHASFYDKYGEVEHLYRYLKINYETQGDYKNAGDFHYGEMEMHRRVSKWRWFPFYWYSLYWALSGYGERPCRALGWLAGFLLALPLLVWGVGLDWVTGGTTPGFLETFTYIFEKAMFQRPPQLSNLNLLGGFISNLSLLIIPGQAALFLLALRNRLGRRR
jgi:uncharacterized protein YjbI with pentapeptide repeats